MKDDLEKIRKSLPGDLQTKSRRRTITAIVATSGVANSKWTKPFISSVVLPAHAVSSPGSGADPGGGATTPSPTTTNQGDCPNAIDSFSIGQDLGCTLTAVQYFRIVIDDSLAPTGPYCYTVEGPSDDTLPGNFLRIELRRTVSLNAGIRVDGSISSNGLANDCGNPTSDTTTGVAQTAGFPNGTTRTFNFDFVRETTGGVRMTINNFSIT